MQCTNSNGHTVVYSGKDLQDIQKSLQISSCGIILQSMLLLLVLFQLYQKILKTMSIWRTILFHSLLITSVSFDFLKYLQQCLNCTYFCHGGSPNLSFWPFIFLSRMCVCGALTVLVQISSFITKKIKVSALIITVLFAFQAIFSVIMTIHVFVVSFDTPEGHTIVEIVGGSAWYIGFCCASLAFMLVAGGVLGVYTNLFRVKVVLVSLALALIIKLVAFSMYVSRRQIHENTSMKLWGSRYSWSYTLIVHYIPNTVMMLSLLWLHHHYHQKEAKDDHVGAHGDPETTTVACELDYPPVYNINDS